MTNTMTPAFSLRRLAGAALTLSCALSFAATAHAAASCGKAPSGELTAERIAAAQPTQTGGSLFEGAVWIKDALYFSDFATSGNFPSRIRKLNPDGTVTTFLEDAGSNGLAVDNDGNLVAATHKFKALSRYTLPDAKRTTIAGKYAGNVFNSPNDATVMKDGTIYFTDPDYQVAAAPGKQPVTGIYRVARDGKVTLLDGTRHNPNGVSLSPKQDVLYVNASDNILRAYPIVKGVAQTKGARDLVTGLESADGMAVDCHGNIYVTEHPAHRVRVFTPQGKQLATIHVDANITNAAFGGADGKTLYLTGAQALWQVKVDVTGSPY
jgi:gluconolactonase